MTFLHWFRLNINYRSLASFQSWQTLSALADVVLVDCPKMSIIPSSEYMKLWYFLLDVPFCLRFESPRGRKEDQNIAKSLVTWKLNWERNTWKYLFILCKLHIILGKIHICEHFMRMKFQEDLILPSVILDLMN